MAVLALFGAACEGTSPVASPDAVDLGNGQQLFVTGCGACHTLAKAGTDGVVGPGMTVTIRFVKDDEEVTFLLASREESGSPIDVYSPRSPLGAAISGKKVGEKATYSLPNGRASTVEILEAVPYVGA